MFPPRPPRIKRKATQRRTNKRGNNDLGRTVTKCAAPRPAWWPLSPSRSQLGLIGHRVPFWSCASRTVLATGPDRCQAGLMSGDEERDGVSLTHLDQPLFDGADAVK